jgi:hypothetical protein
MKLLAILSSAFILALPTIVSAKTCWCDYGSCHYNGGCVDLGVVDNSKTEGCNLVFGNAIGICRCNRDGASINCCKTCPR